MEPGARPRPANVIYDRAASTASKLTGTDVDWDYVATARHIHLTGITPALSDTCQQVIYNTVEFAESQGIPVSFDVNYRAKLWTCAEAREVLNPILSRITLLLTTLEDAERVLQITGEPETVCRTLYSQCGCPWIIVTLGERGAIALVEGDIYTTPGYEIEIIDRIGAGDAFAAGAIHGFMKRNPQIALDYGCAMAALKHTIREDICFLDIEDINRLLATGHADVQR